MNSEQPTSLHEGAYRRLFLFYTCVNRACAARSPHTSFKSVANQRSQQAQKFYKLKSLSPGVRDHCDAGWLCVRTTPTRRSGAVRHKMLTASALQSPYIDQHVNSPSSVYQWRHALDSITWGVLTKETNWIRSIPTPSHTLLSKGLSVAYLTLWGQTRKKSS